MQTNSDINAVTLTPFLEVPVRSFGISIFARLRFGLAISGIGKLRSISWSSWDPTTKHE